MYLTCAVVTMETSSVFLRSQGDFQKECSFKGWIGKIQGIICVVDVQFNIYLHVMREKFFLNQLTC